MAVMPAVVLLSFILFLFIILSTTFKGRKKWIMLTTFSILLVVLVCGFFAYFDNYTFRREFSIFFQHTSQYTDGETNAVLPLPTQTAFDYRYSEHAVVYCTNHSPKEVESFYHNLPGLTMKEGPSSRPGSTLYNVTYKGKEMTFMIISQDQPFGGCQFAVDSD